MRGQLPAQHFLFFLLLSVPPAVCVHGHGHDVMCAGINKILIRMSVLPSRRRTQTHTMPSVFLLKAAIVFSYVVHSVRL